MAASFVRGVSRLHVLARVVFCGLFMLFLRTANAQVVSGQDGRTVAGSGTAADSGDGGPATHAALQQPLSVAVDSAGNLYIADYTDHRIRKVDTAGTITTVAGTGTRGSGGDDGPATSAQLEFPNGVAVDSAGNLYIADTSNARIRKVDTAGTISTVAGNGTEGYSGDGGPATRSQLNIPIGVAVDSAGNLYIADYFNHRIRKVDAAGTISTVAGNGTAGYFGDGGPASSAQLSLPYGVAVDSASNLYIVDLDNNRIRKVNAVGTISTVAGTGTGGYGGDGGPATSAQLDPFGIAVDSAGNLYIADFGNDRIRKVDAAGRMSTVAGTGISGYSGDGGAATKAKLSLPYGVAVDAAGNLYIADFNHRIRKVDAATGKINTVAGTGKAGYSGTRRPATVCSTAHN